MNIETELAPGVPSISSLLEEFKSCGPDTGNWNRADDNERVRFAVWDHQSTDGKKRSTSDFEAKPWEGASDLREFLADDIVNEEVAILCAAFWRALVRVQGVQADDAGEAAVMTRLLQWLVMGRMATALAREVELSAQYLRTYGWVAIQPTWVRELGTRNLELSLDAIVAIDPEFALSIVDEAREGEAIDRLRVAYTRVFQQQAEAAGIEEIPKLRTERVRRTLRELRVSGKTTLPVPFVSKAQPEIQALRPFIDVFIPDEVGDVQRGRVYVRNWYRAEELRGKILAEGWDEDWVEEAIKTAGVQSVWVRSNTLDSLAGWSVRTQQNSPWIEVVTCYSWRVDEDGVPGIYVTTFSPHFLKTETGTKESFATHGLCDYAHGQVPIVVGVREWICRSVTASRGVPEVAAPLQRLSKVMLDSLIDRQSITTLPPRTVPPRLMDEDHEFGPAAVIPVMRGEEPKFMDVPAHDGVAESILRLAWERTDQAFGRLSAEVPPARVQAKQQHMVNSFLGLWAGVFRQVLALVVQYMPDQEFERVTGFPKPRMGPTEIAGSYDLILTVDVRELDMDFALKQLEAVSKFVLPEDAAGVVDRAKLVRLKLQAINPALAREVVADTAGAQQKLFRDVQSEIASMFLGNPPALVENDPTAPMQLQFAAQIIASNPNYQAALQQGGRFAEMLQVWGKNRLQSKVQQENKVVGRLGVQPVQGQPA